MIKMKLKKLIFPNISRILEYPRLAYGKLIFRDSRGSYLVAIESLSEKKHISAERIPKTLRANTTFFAQLLDATEI